MKPFLTYEQQLHKLTDEKQLIINNREFAEEKLRDIGYFALIGGYKEPFRDAMTRVYLENTTLKIYMHSTILIIDFASLYFDISVKLKRKFVISSVIHFVKYTERCRHIILTPPAIIM